MTESEKQHRIKLIFLIMIVEFEKLKRSENKTGLVIIENTLELFKWSCELYRVSKMKVFQSGGIVCPDSKIFVNSQ